MNLVKDSEKNVLEVLQNKQAAKFTSLPVFRYHPTPMLIIENATLNIIDSNLSATSLYGYTAHEFRNLNIFSLLPDPGEFIRSRSEFCNSQLLDDFILRSDHVSKTGFLISVSTQSIAVDSDDASERCLVINNLTEYTQLKKVISFRNLLEEKIQNISSRFIGIDTENLDLEINNALQIIGEITGADRSYLFQLGTDEKRFTNTHEWCAENISPQIQILQDLPVDDFIWFFDTLRNNDFLYIPELSSIPADAENVREILNVQEIKSLFAVPLTTENKFIGFCGFDFVNHNMYWDKSIVKTLKSVGVIFSNALERKQKNENNYLLMQALNQTVSGIVITDPTLPDNPIVYCNPAYEEITGYSLEELKGKNPNLFHGQETNPASIEKINSAIKEKRECTEVILNYRKDGTKFWNEVSISPVFNSTGKLTNFIGVKTDITERFNSENALRESETKLRSVIEQSANGVFITDEQGNYIEWNKKLEEITEISREYALTKKLWDIHFELSPPESRTEESFNFRVKLGQELLSGKSNQQDSFIEEVLHCPSGKIKNVEATLFPIKTSKGFIVAGIVHDLTDNKKNEEQLKILNKAVESGTSSILLSDLNGNIVYINKALLNLGKFTFSEEVIGRQIFEFTNEEGKSLLVNNIIPSLLTGNSWKGEIAIITNDGNQLLVDLQCSLITDDENNPLYLLAYLSDITDRKRMEEALVHKEKMYRSVVESVKEIIFQTDAQGLWTFLNPAWEEITGYKVDESIGELFLNFVHPEDRQRNADYFAPLIERKKEYCRHIVRYLTKSGGFRHIEVFARLTLDKNDEIIGTSGTLTDVTDRIKAEEDIKSNLVKERELSELKSRFVSMVSHEFRTPLTSILASTELLLRYHTKWNDAKKLETTERVFRSAEYMNELVNDVLTLNRVESGKLSFNPAQMDLVSFCKNAIDEVRVLALPSHKISFNYDPENISGVYDEKLLKHVVLNLFSNAIKYSPSGGTILISLLKLQDKISLIVSDEGIGIPPEDQQRLFEPFFRGKNIGNISGTGLGLSILKKSIEMHGGEIKFKSEVNKGTEFTIILPVTD